MNPRELAAPLAAYAAAIGTITAGAYGAPTAWIAGLVAAAASGLIAWHLRGHRDTKRLADLVAVIQQEKLVSAQLARDLNTAQDRAARLDTWHLETAQESARLRAMVNALLEKSL